MSKYPTGYIVDKVESLPIHWDLVQAHDLPAYLQWLNKVGNTLAYCATVTYIPKKVF